MITKIYYSYSPTLAQRVGVNEAVVCQYLAFECEQRGRTNDKWFYRHYKKIAEHFQGLYSPNTIGRIINRLHKKGAIELERIDNYGRNKCMSFRFKNRESLVEAQAVSPTIWFNISDALNFKSVEKAVIINDILFNTAKQTNNKDKGVSIRIPFSSKICGIPLTTYRRAMNSLLKEGVIRNEKTTNTYKLTQPEIKVKNEVVKSIVKEEKTVDFSNEKVRDFYIKKTADQTALHKDQTASHKTKLHYQEVVNELVSQ